MNRILIAARRNGEVVTINGDYLEDVPAATLEAYEGQEWRGVVMVNDPQKECVVLLMERCPCVTRGREANRGLRD